jgi:pimeloyl-ACP methyl ester carboxylesterase
MPIAANLYYAEQKSDSGRLPLVLIHGAGGTHLHWPSAVRRLPGQPVYALDLPGHGKSGGLGQQTIKGYAEGVLEWMQALQISRAVIAGHSMGGAITLYLALHHAERLAGLGLISTGARLRVLPQILENAASELTFPRAVDEIIRGSYSAAAEDQLKELARKRMMEIRPTVLHSDFLACNSFDVMEEIGKIEIPSLVLTGTEDQMTPPRYAQHLFNQLGNARLVLVPEAGHMVILEQPERVASELLNFLTRLN